MCDSTPYMQKPGSIKKLFLEISQNSQENMWKNLFSNKVADFRSISSIMKVGLSPSGKNCVICFIESPLKIMKNAFYFILKALFILKIFKVFVMTFWSCSKKGVIRKIHDKIHDVTGRITNTFNTHIAKYLMK